MFCFLSFFLDGQAQVFLTQSQASITRKESRTARIDCTTQGISDFQSALIHWYRQIPSKAPERILYIGSGQPVYDDNSNKRKYSSVKKGTNLCSFSINDINSNDEGTYYCAYWQAHRTSRPQTACTESCLYPERQLYIKRTEPPLHLPASATSRHFCAEHVNRNNAQGKKQKTAACYTSSGTMCCAGEKEYSWG